MKLSLYNPLSVIGITQNFGNPDPIYFSLGLKGHNGIDFLAYLGQPIFASHDGLAYFEIDSGGGHGVTVETNITFDYKDTQAYYKSIYWHMCDASVYPLLKSPIESWPSGKQVRAGELIGYADNTGLSTGTHLHFGLKPMNDRYNNAEQNNGYFGAVDPTPYMNYQFIGKYPFNRNLYFGMTGDEDVRQLQKILGVQPRSGNFGPLTFLAVQKYQRNNGIMGTGYVGPQTRATLNK